MSKTVLDAIKSRRSIREFTDDPVSVESLRLIVEAGIWAPSGLNNQPWRFVIISDYGVRKKISELTHYSHIVLAAHALIAVYLDVGAMYDDTKDHQSAGACIQNMLLAAEELGLGAVWLGQILKNKKRVNALLKLDEDLDLMAIIALGYPQHRNQQSQRKSLAEFIIKEI